ncbi:MAG: HNH endonuclease [Candidatus Thorarchaeota archaeon]
MAWPGQVQSDGTGHVRAVFGKEVSSIDRDIREERLELDDYECQLSKLFGITHLSSKPCSDQLEAHHITYKRAGHELVGDLITVCSRCHDILTDAIRRERYKVRSLDLIDQRQDIVARNCEPERTKKDVTEIELQDQGCFGLACAQRPVGRSVKSIYHRHEGNLIEAEKGRGGLHGNGAPRVPG